MQSPPPAVFHDKYQLEIWKNTAGKSANYLFSLVAICLMYFKLKEYTKHFMFSLLTKGALSLLLLFLASIQ